MLNFARRWRMTIVFEDEDHFPISTIYKISNYETHPWKS
jgi:hypothetical protein